LQNAKEKVILHQPNYQRGDNNIQPQKNNFKKSLLLINALKRIIYTKTPTFSLKKGVSKGVKK